MTKQQLQSAVTSIQEVSALYKKLGEALQLHVVSLSRLSETGARFDLRGQTVDADGKPLFNDMSPQEKVVKSFFEDFYKATPGPVTITPIDGLFR